MASLWGCQQIGGAALAGRELAEQYGEENVDLEVIDDDGVTSVDVTITEPSIDAADREELERSAREAAEIVARHVPLGEDGGVTIDFVTRDEEGIVRTTRASTFRYDAWELPGRP
ncbi:MAG TPA: hypothetical protein VM737_09205 [Gemmatimonadota bacterium]|nr:hypothetical protein [Gemmatimonadota bacterium]